MKDAAGDKINQQKRTEEIFEKLGVKQLTDDQYNKVKEAADTLLKSTDTNAIKEAKDTILENIPELADKSFDELNRLAEEPFSESRAKWNKFVDKTFKSGGKTIVKGGRSPGLDIVFKSAVRYMFENPGKTKGGFKEFFKTVFRIHLKFGTRLSREDLYGDRLKRLREEVEESEHSRKKFKGLLDMKAAASGQAASNSINKIIDDEMNQGGACGSTMMAFSSEAIRSSFCKQKKRKILEDTFEWEGDTLTFETIDEEGIKVEHDLKIRKEDMGLPEYAKESVANLEELGVEREYLGKNEHATKPLPGVGEAGMALGVYGAFVGILSSAKYLQKGEFGQAAFSITQTVYIVGGMSGLNKLVEEASQKAFAKLMGFSADKAGVEKALEKMTELAIEAVGETAARVIGRAVEIIPFVGLAFDLYFIGMDIADLADTTSKTPLALKIVHLILDVSVTILSLVETAFPPAAPFIEPVIIFLTILRVSIDDFYTDIKEELDKVAGKSFGYQIAAFMEGFGEGAIDFLTLGLYSEHEKLQDQLNYKREFYNNMTNPSKFFEYHYNNSQSELDFTSGAVSQFGGFLDVRLHNNGSFTMTMANVPTKHGPPQTIIETITLPHPVDQIILGVGTTYVPIYMEQTAKLWMFIPIETEEVIGDFDEQKSSRYGVYTGNDLNNTFVTIQSQADAEKQPSIESFTRHRFMLDSQIEDPQLNKRTTMDALSMIDDLESKKPIFSAFGNSIHVDECHDLNAASNITKYLKTYNYNLYGKDGDDKFFLGPQQTLISGDNGKDLYFIQPSGGRSIIDNFAIDEEMDTLYFNVSFENIKCNRHNWDLLIGFCDSHFIILRNWFNHEKNEFYRHLNILSKDGIIMEPTETTINNGEYSISCDATMIDKTESKEDQQITLAGKFSRVKNVFGSNYSDVIVGNELPNIINCGRGNDFLEGGDGKDVYVIGGNDDRDHINNYAKDMKEDTIVFSIPYTRIVAGKTGNNLLLFDKKNSNSELQMQNWFSSSLYQHATFLSKDFVQFTVELNANGGLLLVPLTIDLGKYKHGVVIDLNETGHNINYDINSAEMRYVKTIFDSKYNDWLIGNALSNILACTGGSDVLKGNTGKETYIANTDCSHLVIDNYDAVKDMDLLLIQCSHNDISLENPPNSVNLSITCMKNGQHFEVVLLNWFMGKDYQHLYVKTGDLITSFLPSNKTELDQCNGKPTPVEIQFNKGCGGHFRVVDLRLPEYRKVERVQANNGSCSHSIYGNSINNYIDPGPGDPYGYQYLEGGNGTDAYVLGHNYSIYNTINNYAEDNRTDHLLFGVVFDDIVVQREEKDISVSSKSRNDSIRVKIVNYFAGSLYQHIVVETADNFMFRFAEKYPYIEVIMIDLSSSKFSQVVSPHENTSFKDVTFIIGSKTAQNHITGGFYSRKIIGGNASDVIYGGPLSEDLIGFQGADIIYGGRGDDGIYGGVGDDVLYGDEGSDQFFGDVGGDSINGGNGSDYIVFSGVDSNGVIVNLQVGIGINSDAENDTYESIEHILGSEYNDVLMGNSDSNIIRGYAGNDTIFAFGGYDLLHGGVGSDLYILDDASGIKMINNFATDKALDLVSLQNHSSSSVCHFYLEEDLVMNISFFQTNFKRMQRLITGEDSLEITIAFALKNTTYQHLVFFFSDVLKNVSDFIETGNQLGPVFNQVFNGSFLHVSCQTETKICIDVNYTAISANDAPPDKYTLELAQRGN